MKLIKLTAENVLRLKAVTIEANGNHVRITGANDQGKSSVLKALTMAMGGKETVPEKPIREGEATAEVIADFGDLIVRRRFVAGQTVHTYLSVESKDGARYPSPQSILDRMFGRNGNTPLIAFDPLEFSRMHKKDQRKVLLQIADLNLDLDQWQKDLEWLEGERRSANRMVRELEGTVARLEPIPDDTPDEPISVGTLMRELEGVQEQRRRYEKHVAQKHQAQIIYDAAVKEVQDLEVKLQSLKEKLPQLAGNVLACGDNIPPAVPDEAPIRARLETADAVNRQVALKARCKETHRQLKAAESAAEILQKKVQNHRAIRATALTEAKMPIPGLSVSDDGVLYEGIPFEQLSDSKKLKVSLAMAMARNPEVRMILIDRLELLDEANQAVLHEMATSQGYQIISTVVQSKPGEVGVHIVDGEVAAVDGVAV